MVAAGRQHRGGTGEGAAGAGGQRLAGLEPGQPGQRGAAGGQPVGSGHGGAVEDCGAHRDLLGVWSGRSGRGPGPGGGCIKVARVLRGDVERADILFRESLAAHQAELNKAGMIDCLIGLGAAAVLAGLPAAGARLLAAAAAIRAQRAGSVWPAKRMEIDQYLDMARARLSEAEYQAEQAAGRAMSLEQAVNYAQNLPLKPEIAPASEETPDGLTGREREIAALIGLGKTNGEIASELVLSKRTVESHVGNILSKLGLTSRGQIMRWAIDHGLTRTPA